MSNLISNLEKTTLTGVLNDHFDTFSRDIIIYKKPLSNPINITESILPGYSDASIYPDVTYTIISGIYPAIRVNKNDHESQKIDEIKMSVEGNGIVKIKVKEEAMRFIESGANEKVIIDENSYNIVGNKYTQNYLGLKFYYYRVQITS